MKNKTIAYLLWLVFGLIGGHRFYLSSWLGGAAYLLSLVAMGALPDSLVLQIVSSCYFIYYLYDIYWIYQWKQPIANTSGSVGKPTAETVETANEQVHAMQPDNQNLTRTKRKDMTNLNNLLEVASSTEVKSVLKGVAGTFVRRAEMTHGDSDLTIDVEFRAYDEAILGEKDDFSSELVLYTEIKCKEDHDEVDEDYYEQWADGINEYMHEHITKLPSALQTWVEDTYEAAIMLNGVKMY